MMVLLVGTVAQELTNWIKSPLGIIHLRPQSA
jgi:hypothetical protein